MHLNKPELTLSFLLEIEAEMARKASVVDIVLPPQFRKPQASPTVINRNAGLMKSQ